MKLTKIVQHQNQRLRNEEIGDRFQLPVKSASERWFDDDRAEADH